MRETLQSQTANVMIFLALASDSKTGATGKTLTLTISKNGGAFNPIAPTVTERGNGWYSVALTTTMTDTLGDLVIHAEAPDSDPADVKLLVVAQDGGYKVISTASASNTAIANAVASVDLTGELAKGTLAAYVYDIRANTITIESAIAAAQNAIIAAGDTIQVTVTNPPAISVVVA